MGLWLGWGMASALKTGLPIRVSGVVVLAGVLVGSWEVMRQWWRWRTERREPPADRPPAVPAAEANRRPVGEGRPIEGQTGS
jgi:hypothetical protein